VGDLPRPLPLLRRAAGDVADNARDVDFAMRWGFGWAGPFELWQAAGWADTARPSPPTSRPARR
jgi:3-hydroxyacyl-CoA dehydrogenase